MKLFDRKPGFLKPGKGVERNAKKKNAFFAFFELLYRKFMKLFIINIVYAILILPVICGAIVLLTGAFQLSEEVIKEGSFLISNVLQLVSNIPAPVSIILLVVDLIFFGPLTAGFSYMLRNYANERHAWFSDFFSRAMANFKQGFVLGLIDIAVLTSVVLYLAADISALKGSWGYYLYFAMKMAAVLISLFYAFMRFYTYNIAITFELPLKDILKNAAIFAVLGFVRNVIALVIIIASVFAFTSTSIIDMILVLTFLFAFCGFVGTYATYPVIKKYMLEEDNDDSVPEDGDNSEENAAYTE